ncbi:hypothetical protein I3842_03G129600 [Carya illinoinensis]|uniref:Uncharacterized protein n=1 Tax=Carya illinoinensis TaxID=32201 RepID=A0A922FK84_CARIL|nr:hypothetical protein I3842_03G129600 [Carya illinoinensis]
MPWLSAPYSQNLESSVDVNDKVGGRDNKASSISSSQEDQAQKQKHEQQHAASVQSKHQPRTQSTPLITVLRSSPSKQEADSRDNEIISRGTSTEHSMHKEESHVQSKHDQPRTEAPTVLRSPSKQGAADSRDNEIISRRTTEHPVHKEAAGHVPSKDQQPKNFDAGLKEQSRFETSPVVLVKEQYPSKPPKQDDGHDNKGPRRGTTIENHDHVRKEADMPKDHQALLRQKENGGVTNINPDPPVNNNPITVLNINVYVDQPKSVDKNDIAIKKNKAPDPKPQNGVVSSKPPSERKCCCTIL